jgi:hypothetical protein
VYAVDRPQGGVGEADLSSGGNESFGAPLLADFPRNGVRGLKIESGKPPGEGLDLRGAVLRLLQLAGDGRDVGRGAQGLRRLQAATPKSAPTPAVSAIARAPQKVTRAAAEAADAPPARAESDPRSARKRSEPMNTAHTSAEDGKRSTITSGSNAPTAKVAAEANAA